MDKRVENNFILTGNNIDLRIFRAANLFDLESEVRLQSLRHKKGRPEKSYLWGSNPIYNIDQISP